MLELRVGGWFQCRLATDPDPTDDPRGVSGWTFALPGEPDLDRTIRTQPAGVVTRPLAPPIGVRVTSVASDGRRVEDHVLLGAAFELLDDPVFEGRNGLASEDTEEPIFPFHLRIAKEGAILRREMRDLMTGEWAFRLSSGAAPNPDALLQAGVGDPRVYLQRRRSDVEALLSRATDDTEKLQLETRLKHLGRRGLGPVPMVVGLRYRYVLDGPWADVQDPGKVLGATVEYAPWLVDLWVGCWDADGLCGYMMGTLTLPARR